MARFAFVFDERICRFGITINVSTPPSPSSTMSVHLVPNALTIAYEFPVANFAGKMFRPMNALHVRSERFHPLKGLGAT